MNKELLMRILKSIYIALFRAHASAKNVKGGSGHFNEQCHPGTYG